MQKTMLGVLAGLALLMGEVKAMQVQVIPLPQVVAASTAVLLVEVESATDHSGPCEDSHRAHYRVLEVLKGTAPAEPDRNVWSMQPKSGPNCITISYATYEGTVKPPFIKGQRLLVFLGAQTANAFEAAARLEEIRRLLTSAKR